MCPIPVSTIQIIGILCENVVFAELHAEMHVKSCLNLFLIVSKQALKRVHFRLENAEFCSENHAEIG